MSRQTLLYTHPRGRRLMVWLLRGAWAAAVLVAWSATAGPPAAADAAASRDWLAALVAGGTMAVLAGALSAFAARYVTAIRQDPAGFDVETPGLLGARTRRFASDSARRLDDPEDLADAALGNRSGLGAAINAWLAHQLFRTPFDLLKIDGRLFVLDGKGETPDPRRFGAFLAGGVWSERR